MTTHPVYCTDPVGAQRSTASPHPPHIPSCAPLRAPKPQPAQQPPPPESCTVRSVLPAVTIEAVKNRKNDAYWHGKICPLPKEPSK